MTLAAHVDLSAQEGPDRQHHGPGAELQSCVSPDPAYAVPIDYQVVDAVLEQRQSAGRLQLRPYGRLVQQAVGLRPGGAHRRSLAGVEPAEMDAGAIGRRRNGPAKRVDLARQVALPDAADRRIAAHLPERVQAVRNQQNARSHA